MTAHVTPVRVYVWVFLALMVLTAITTAAAFVDLGPLNDVVALLIAFGKAALVVLFFMHVRHASRLTKLVVVAGLFWLFLLIGITIADYATRDFLRLPSATEKGLDTATGRPKHHSAEKS